MRGASPTTGRSIRLLWPLRPGYRLPVATLVNWLGTDVFLHFDPTVCQRVALHPLCRWSLIGQEPPFERIGFLDLADQPRPGAFRARCEVSGRLLDW